MKSFLSFSLSIVVLFSFGCGVRNESQDLTGVANESSVTAEIGNKLVSTTEPGKKKIMNIKEDLKFNDARPAILSIISSEKVNVKMFGLKKGQILPKHKAGLKSLLIMMEGKIEFAIDGQVFELNQFDTYEIPVNVEHEIRGIEQSIFSLTQEK